MLEQCGDHAETPTLAVIAYHFGFISSLIFSGDTHNSIVIIPKKWNNRPVQATLMQAPGPLLLPAKTERNNYVL